MSGGLSSRGLETLGSVLGWLRAALEQFWCLLGCVGGVLRWVYGSALEHFWCVLCCFLWILGLWGLSWAGFASSYASLGQVLSTLGVFWVVLEGSWASLISSEDSLGVY